MKHSTHTLAERVEEIQEQIKKEEGVGKMKKQTFLEFGESLIAVKNPMTLPKFAIAVSESGLHMLVDDILTPKESMRLIREIKNALFEWSKMTGKYVDTGKEHGKD